MEKVRENARRAADMDAEGEALQANGERTYVGNLYARAGLAALSAKPIRYDLHGLRQVSRSECKLQDDR